MKYLLKGPKFWFFEPDEIPVKLKDCLKFLGEYQFLDLKDYVPFYIKLTLLLSNKEVATVEWPEDLPKLDTFQVHEYSGNVTFYIDGKYYPLTYGTPFIIKPQQLHVCKFHKIQKHEFFCFWIGEKPPSSLLSFFNQPDLSPVYELEDSVKQTMIDLFFTLYNFSNAENCEIEKASCFLNILKIFKQHASTTNE